MELATTVGKLERILSNFLCDPYAVELLEENPDIKEAIG
jgi:hypothetical protein